MSTDAKVRWKLNEQGAVQYGGEGGEGSATAAVAHPRLTTRTLFAECTAACYARTYNKSVWELCTEENRTSEQARTVLRLRAATTVRLTHPPVATWLLRDVTATSPQWVGTSSVSAGSY